MSSGRPARAVEAAASNPAIPEARGDDTVEGVGVEQEEWVEELMAALCGKSLIGYLNPSQSEHLPSELAYKVALTLRQWQRSDRYERAAAV